MKLNEYYNILLDCFSDGKTVWTDNDISKGFVPPRKNDMYFKVRGKLISRKQIFNPLYTIKMLPKLDCPF